MSALLAGFAVIATAAAGDLFARWLCAGSNHRRAARCGFALVLGPGVIAFALFVLGLVGVPLGATTCRVLAIGCVVAALALRRARGTGNPIAEPGALAANGRALVAVAVVPAACVALGLAFVLVAPLAHDAFSNWGLKSLAFWRDATLATPDLRDHLRVLFHPNYPLLVPLAQTFVHGVAGEPSERAARAVFLLAQVGSGLVLFSGLARFMRPLFAAVAGAMLCATPHFWRSNELLRFAGSVPSGYADPMFTALVAATVAAALTLAGPTDRPNHRGAILLGTCAGFALFTKNEGQPLVIALFFAGVVAAVFTRSRDRLRGRLAATAIATATAIVIAAPWFAYRAGLPSRDENYSELLTFDRVADGAWRMPVVVTGAVAEALAVERHGLVWIALCVALLLRARRLVDATAAFAFALLAAMAAAYAAVFVVTPLPIVDSLSTSMPRTFFHMTPVAIALMALLVAPKNADGAP